MCKDTIYFNKCLAFTKCSKVNNGVYYHQPFSFFIIIKIIDNSYIITMCQAIRTKCFTRSFVIASLIFIMTIPGGILFITPFLQFRSWNREWSSDWPKTTWLTSGRIRILNPGSLPFLFVHWFQGGRGRDRETERHQWWERSAASCTPHCALRVEPITQACALIGIEPWPPGS